MLSIWTFVYRYFLAPLIRGLFFIGKSFNQKIAQGYQLRTQQPTPWLTGPRQSQPIWFHCASGEFEYALPILRQCKSLFPKLPILVTYFSPSYVSNIKNCPDVDMHFPLPWDHPKTWKAFFQYHNPRILMISRTDVWPEMVVQCRLHKVPTALFAKMVNSQKNPIARKWDQHWHKYLNKIFLVSTEDLHALGWENPSQPVPQKFAVAGDPRYDQCLFRLSRPKLTMKPPKKAKLTLILASLWPADELVVLNNISKTLDSFRIIVVPHEPNPKNLSRIRSTLALQNKTAIDFSQYRGGEPFEILLVDRLGILADLYSWADLAYIGGSFDRGVHSVMEALIQGLPCLVGPKHFNNREALQFKKISPTKEGRLFAVQEISNSDAFENALNQFQTQWTKEDQKKLSKLVGEKAGATQEIIKWMASQLEHS